MPSTYLLDNPKFSSVILAEVGPWNVTAQEFLLSYEYGPAFTKREADSKKHYLTYMIYEKLLALDGYDRGLQSSPMVKEVLNEVEADLATEELYKDDVLNTIHISDKEIERGVSGENVHLGLKWFFSPAKDDILQDAKLLRNGASFDSLFDVRCPDSASADNRSMQTTRFTLEMKNEALASGHRFADRRQGDSADSCPRRMVHRENCRRMDKPDRDGIGEHETPRRRPPRPASA